VIESLLYLTTSAIGNVDVYHTIIIYRGMECAWP